MNNPAVNLVDQVSLWHDWTSLRCIPKIGIAGSFGTSQSFLKWLFKFALPPGVEVCSPWSILTGVNCFSEPSWGFSLVLYPFPNEFSRLVLLSFAKQHLLSKNSLRLFHHRLLCQPEILWDPDPEPTACFPSPNLLRPPHNTGYDRVRYPLSQSA